jgi:hypothetical protein
MFKNPCGVFIFAIFVAAVTSAIADDQQATLEPSAFVGHWAGGAWDDCLENELTIDKVEGNTVLGTYHWGTCVGWRVNRSGSEPFIGTLEDSALVFTTSWEGHLRYKLEDNGTLSGSYQYKDRPKTWPITLTRMSDD